MRAKSAKSAFQVAALAARQHGVVDRRQLREAGVSDSGISRRVQSGQLHRVHRRVYAVGHGGLSQEGRWLAAVLACGDRATLSHRSAAALLRLLDNQTGPIDVSVPGITGRKSRAGIRIHRRTSLSSQDVIQRKRIPVTTPARTIADLRRIASPAELRRAIRQTEVLGLRTGLESTSERTRSELEHLFLRLCEKHELPTPEVNVRIGSYVADFLWRRQRVVVETDGYRYHRGSRAFEDDHDRDLELRRLGYDVVHLTYRQVTTAPERAAGAVADALRRS